MNRLTRYLWLILLALVVGGIWVSFSRCATPSDKHAGTGGHTRDAGAGADGTPAMPTVREHRREQKPQADPLANIQSPLARRYLRFMLPGGRLDEESHDGSIVNNAFKQAWGVTARLDLTEEQQDRLAEFLLQEDWLDWRRIDPKSIEKWASQHLTDSQRAALLAFIEESKAGERSLSDLRMELKKREHGVGSPEEAFKAEMTQTRRIAELLAADTDKLPPEEVEKMRLELKNLTKTAVSGASEDEKKALAESRQDEHAYQFFNLLAERIPMTEEQQLSVYDSLRTGKEAPCNPYDYQSSPPDRIEASVREATRWMGDVLTQEQYETYLRHFLAEIEMIRYQSGR